MRILIIARVTQPRMMRLIGMREIEGAEAAKEARRASAVADLGELDVGHDVVRVATVARRRTR